VVLSTALCVFAYGVFYGVMLFSSERSWTASICRSLYFWAEKWGFRPR